MTVVIAAEHELAGLRQMPPADSVSPRMAAHQARLAAKRAERWAENKGVLWGSDIQLLRDLESLANYVIVLADTTEEKP